MGFEMEFNFTTRVDDVLDDITKAKAELDQDALIQDSRDFITGPEVTGALNAILLTFPGETYADAEAQKWNDVWKWNTLNDFQKQQALDKIIITRTKLNDSINLLSEMRTTVEIVTASQASLRTDMDDIDLQLKNLKQIDTRQIWSPHFGPSKTNNNSAAFGSPVNMTSQTESNRNVEQNPPLLLLETDPSQNPNNLA
jgi:hypothetical protein